LQGHTKNQSVIGRINRDEGDRGEYRIIATAAG